MKKKSESPENSGKIQGNQFKPGQSGNPSGKPKGAKNHATRLAESLLDSQVKELVEKCVEMALSGNGQAMKICMDRLISVRKDRPISLAPPQLENAEDAAKAMKSIAGAVSESKITPSEAQILSAVIENYRKVTETTEIEKRLTALEARNNQK